jgi:hypothetical protein
VSGLLGGKKFVDLMSDYQMLKKGLASDRYVEVFKCSDRIDIYSENKPSVPSYVYDGAMFKKKKSRVQIHCIGPQKFILSNFERKSVFA